MVVMVVCNFEQKAGSAALMSIRAGCIIACCYPSHMPENRHIAESPRYDAGEALGRRFGLPEGLFLVIIATSSG
jgi:TRAP-type uncharacterized transport system fused permease subunit